MSEPIRILFVGELQSSHALSWIELLSPFGDEFEIHGLHTSSAPLPKTNFSIIDVKYLSYFQSHWLPKLDRIQKYLGLKKKVFKPSYIHGYGYSHPHMMDNIQRT